MRAFQRGIVEAANVSTIGLYRNSCRFPGNIQEFPSFRVAKNTAIVNKMNDFNVIAMML